MTLVAEAQATFFADAAKKNTFCPLCHRPGRVNPYRLSPMLATLLNRLVLGKAIKRHYKDFPRIKHPFKDGAKSKRVTDYNKLQHFGLLEPNGEGKWSVTDLAWAFVTDQVLVPEQVFVYKGKRVGETADKVRYSEIIGGPLPRRSVTAPILSIECSLGALDLDTAISRHQDHLEQGCVCLVCGRFNKIYNRAIQPPIARWLGHLAHNGGWQSPYAQYNEAPNGEYIYLEFRGLIESTKIDDAKKWRATDLGHQFVGGEIKIPKYVCVLNDKCLGFKGPKISYFDCLTEKSVLV